MKTKLLLFVLACFVVVCITTSVICFLDSNVILAILILLVAVVISYSFVGLVLYRSFMRNRIIDPKIDLKRNYDQILLGEMSKQVIATDNTLDLRGYHRNAHTDVLMAERYYSFLKQNGFIVIFVSNSDYYQNSNKINPIDYPLLHPVTLLEHGLSASNYRYALLNPIGGFMFITFRIMNLFYRKNGKFQSIRKFDSLLYFCKERGVKLVIKTNC